MQRSFVSFYVGETLLGIDVLHVREINREIEITTVSPSPDFVAGLLNLRGQIVTVIRPGVKIGLSQSGSTDTSCCVVLKTNRELEALGRKGMVLEPTCDDLVGLMVDSVADIVPAADEQIEPPPANLSGVATGHLRGIVKLDKGLLAVLRLSTILSSTQ